VASGVTLSGPRAHAIIETVLGSLSALTDLAMLCDGANERDTRRREMLRMIKLYLSDVIEE